MIINIHIPGVHTSAAFGNLYLLDLNMRHLISGTSTFIPHPFPLYREHIHYINASISSYIHQIVTDTQSLSDIKKLLCTQYARYIRCPNYTRGQRVIHLHDGPLSGTNGYMMIKTHKSLGRITDTVMRIRFKRILHTAVSDASTLFL